MGQPPFVAKHAYSSSQLSVPIFSAASINDWGLPMLTNGRKRM